MNNLLDSSTAAFNNNTTITCTPDNIALDNNMSDLDELFNFINDDTPLVDQNNNGYNTTDQTFFEPTSPLSCPPPLSIPQVKSLGKNMSTMKKVYEETKPQCYSPISTNGEDNDNDEANKEPIVDSFTISTKTSVEPVKLEKDKEEEEFPLDPAMKLVMFDPPRHSYDLSMSFPEVTYRLEDGMPSLIYHVFQANSKKLLSLTSEDINDMIYAVSKPFATNKKRDTPEGCYVLLKTERKAVDLLFLATGAAKVEPVAASAIGASAADQIVQLTMIMLGQARLQLALPGIYNGAYYNVPHFARVTAKRGREAIKETNKTTPFNKKIMLS